MDYKGPGKRNRNDRDSTESDTTPPKYKSKPTPTTTNYFKEPETVYTESSDSDTATNQHLKETRKISTYFSPKVDSDKKASHEPKGEMEEISKSIAHLSHIMDTTMSQMSAQIAELVISNNRVTTTANEAKEAVKAIETHVNQLEKHVQQQETTILKQQSKIASLESYSKYYNLKLFNVPETSNENSQSLLDNFRHLLHTLEINPANIYIDTIHRLPTNGQGPRPIIVKFVSKLDRDLVWSKKTKLPSTGTNIYMREHFDEITEKNIRKLLPIRRAAIDLGKKVRLVGDKLTIDS